MTLATDQYSSELSSAKMGCCKKTRKGFNQTTIGLVRQPAQPVKMCYGQNMVYGLRSSYHEKIDGGGMTHRTIPQHGYLIQLLTMEQICFFLKIVYPKPTSCIICSLLKWSIYSMALRHMLTLSTLGVCRCLWLGRMCCSRIWRFSIWPCSLQPFGGQFPQSERGIQ